MQPHKIAKTLRKTASKQEKSEVKKFVRPLSNPLQATYKIGGIACEN